MNQLATISLFAWLPIVIYIFSSRPARVAVVSSFIFAWLFLPNIGWKLSGLPDYTKTSATIFGVLLCLVLFDMPRLLAFRLRWFDAPMAVFCACPFVTALTVGTGPYDGLSAVLVQLWTWGFPYFIGRIYFADPEGIRELATGIVIGGLIYVPFCLVEIRLSPQFETWVYGIYHWEGFRYGGFRPKVFLSSGLELGLWMACSSFLAHRLWANGALKSLRGYPFSYMALAMGVTTVLCKSTGAIVLLVAGLGNTWVAAKARAAWPVWLLIAIAPAYSSTRITGLFSGRELVQAARVFGEDRAQSLDFRIYNEDALIRHALKKPIFGGGRAEGNTTFHPDGSLAIIDGYWIIVFCQMGVVGLASMLAATLQPLVLLVRRYPVATWSRPEMAAIVGLSGLTGLIMVDELSNAMMNPFYGIILGALTALPRLRPDRGARLAEEALADALELAEAGHLAESEPLFWRAIELAEAEDEGPEADWIRAGALEGLGDALMAAGRVVEAEEAFRDALAIREELAAGPADAEAARDLAVARERLARALAELGRADDAIALRGRAMETWDDLASRDPGDPEVREHRVDALNDLAWLLAAEAPRGLRDPERAVRLALEAARLDPDRAGSWNTLGAALHRAGDDAGAIEALERSVSAGPPGGTAFDQYFLAMAWARLGEVDKARAWFDRGVAWSEIHRPDHPALIRFRDEARALLDGSRPVPADS